MGSLERRRGHLLSFRADPEKPTTWTGVERADRVVIEDALADGRLDPNIFCTGVYCGCVPAAATSRRGMLTDGALEGIYCLRCDIVCECAGQWFALEVKPHLTHKSIGQAVAYRELLPWCYPRLAGIAGGVLCETARSEMCAAARDGAGLLVLCGEEYDEAAGVIVER